MAKISVIVPIYKVEKYLIQCVDSILNQTLKDIEVLLVDEGDIDACRAIIDMYEFGPKKDPRIKAIHEHNGGYGASCNKGLEYATGEYIGIVEADDILEPEMFEEMYNKAKEFDADVVKTPYIEYYDKTDIFEELKEDCFWRNWANEVPQDKLINVQDYPVFMGIHPSIWSCIYKKSYLDKKNIRFLGAKGAGYVDTPFRADTFLNTDKILWFNKPFYNYRLSNDEASSAVINADTMINRFYELHKTIDEKYKDKFPKIVNWVLREEAINTWLRIESGSAVLKEELYDKLVENLKYYTETDIQQIPYLKNRDKNILKEIKRKPELLKKYIVKSGTHGIGTRIYLFSKFPIGSVKHYKRKKIMTNIFGIPFIKKTRTGDNRTGLFLFGLLPVAELKHYKY